MSKKKSGCGCLLLLVLGIIIAGAVMSNKESPLPTQSLSAPKLTAGLSKFTVDHANAQFVFTLDIKNQESRENTIYVVVYGKNDMFSPPRRNVWPLFGGIFHHAGTRRGRLSSSDISQNWASRPDDSKGMKFVLEPNGAESFEGALPINETSPHDAWQGKPLDPRSMYNEVFLWIYSQDGQLIFEKKYNVK